MAENMDWAEIKMRLRDGASVQVLADLNAVTYKTMYNRIMAHQVKDGVEYLTPRNTKGMQKSKAISKTKQAQAKAKEKKAEAEKVGREIVEGLPKFEAAPEEKQDIPEEVYKPARVADLPEDISNSTIIDVLMDLKRSHADAVQVMHDTESMLEQAQTSERQLRTMLIAVQRLADAEKAQELPEV